LRYSRHLEHLTSPPLLVYIAWRVRSGYIGKKHITKALERFHASNPDVALAINVTRHPYSFLGDSKSGGFLRSGGTWHDGLKDYTDGTDEGARRAEAGLSALGAAAGIKFRFDQQTNWQPMDSQRMLLWAGRHGKGEEFMDALNSAHFQDGKSASDRANVLAAAETAGLDAGAASAFLATRELEDAVWQSYGDTIHKYAIHAIPFFVFSVPAMGMVGGPFREGQAEKTTPWIVNGSMDSDRFLEIFSKVYSVWRQHMTAWL